MNKRRAARRRGLAASDDVMWSLMQAAHAVESQLEEAMAQVELSGAKLAAITQLVDRLEADKLVRRVDDAADRRSLRAAITPLGRERQAAEAKKVDEVRRKLGKALGAIDHAALKRALSDLD